MQAETWGQSAMQASRPESRLSARNAAVHTRKTLRRGWVPQPHWESSYTLRCRELRVFKHLVRRCGWKPHLRYGGRTNSLNLISMGIRVPQPVCQARQPFTSNSLLCHDDREKILTFFY